MITPVQQKIRDKTIKASEWEAMVKSGDWLCFGGAGSDAMACPDVLADRVGEGPGMVKNIELWTYGHFNPMRLHEIDQQEEFHCHHEGFFFPWARKHHDKTLCIDYIPWGWSLGLWNAYYRFFHKEKNKRRLDWTVISSSMPENGYFNFSYGTGAAKILIKSAKKTVLEIREDYPWAEGGSNNTISIDDIDYIVEVDCKKYGWPQILEALPAENEIKIAKNILSIMKDGDCIQLGIGALPTAVAQAISRAGLKNLGIHTEMLQEGLISLIESGAVNNLKKNIDRGKSVWSFALPVNSKRYFDFTHHNHSLAVNDSNYTNNIYQLSRIDNMVAIDNFLAIDLQGQICASHYNERPISGTGGIFEFIAFCALSKGGRSIATASSTRKGTEGKLISRVVPFLPEGSIVDVPAHLVSWVATENGIVNLMGLSNYERARALISLAHPQFQDELEREAKNRNLLPKLFVISADLNERRYPGYEERKNYKIPYTTIWQGCDYNDDVWSGK